MAKKIEVTTPTCPRCRTEHYDPSDWSDAVTYWGDEGRPVSLTCPSCDKDYEVKERIVLRWWDCTAKGGDDE